MRQFLKQSILVIVILASLPAAARIANLTATCTRVSNMNQAGAVRTESREMKIRINFQADSTRVELLFNDNTLNEVLLSNEAAAIRGHDDRSEFLAGSSVFNVSNTRETSNVLISESNFVSTFRMETSTPRGREVQAQDIRCRLSESQWEEISEAHRATVAGEAVPFHNGASNPALFAELKK
jgi:hypothetical protein